MADTALTVMNRVLEKMGRNRVTVFSSDDETNQLLEFMNDAYLELYTTMPSELPGLIVTSGSIITSANTRLYSLASDARNYNLLNWSFENETENDVHLPMVTLQFIQSLSPTYDEVTGAPEYIYLEGTDQIGIYPVPDGAYTINYKYKDEFTPLSATTDTFVFPDEWIRLFIDVKTEAMFKETRGFQEADKQFAKAERRLNELIGLASVMIPTDLDTGIIY